MQGDRSVRPGAAVQRKPTDKNVQRSGAAVQKIAGPAAAQAGMSMQEGVTAHSPKSSPSPRSVQKCEDRSLQKTEEAPPEKASKPKAARPVQRKQGNAAAASPEDTKDAAAEGVSGSGSGVPDAAKMEELMGADFSGVKVHSGKEAKEGAKAIGAEAYAMGEDIALPGGDKKTLAHELAHVVQQQQGRSPAGGVGKEGDALETEADAVADKVIKGESAAELLGTGGGGGGGKAVQKTVQKKAVQKEEGGAAAPETVTIKVGGVPLKIKLPSGFKGKTYNGKLTTQLAAGVSLSSFKIRFDSKWAVEGGDIDGNIAAKLGDKQLKSTFKLNVGKNGVVSGHVKDAPIEDGPLSGTVTASWSGKKLKAEVKANLTDNLKLGEAKGFGASLLKGGNAEVTFTHDKVLEAKSSGAKMMLSQKGIDRVELSGAGSYKAPGTFDGSGDVRIIKKFEWTGGKFKFWSGLKSKGKFKLNLWNFENLPLNIDWGGGRIKSILNKFSFGKLGLGGLGKFDLDLPIKLPKFGGWMPQLGKGTFFKGGLGKGLLKSLKGTINWTLFKGGKSPFAGLFKNVNFDLGKLSFSGLGSGSLLDDFDFGRIGKFDFKGLGGALSKLKNIELKSGELWKLIGKINLGVFDKDLFARGSIDLSWLKGKGFGKVFGKFKLPKPPAFSTKPWTVQVDKDSTADLDLSGGEINAITGQVGAKVLRDNKPYVHGRFDSFKLKPAKKSFSGKGSLALASDIPLAEKRGWTVTLEKNEASKATFTFRSSTLKAAKGKLSARVDRGGKKLLRVAAMGNYDGKSFSGKGTAKLLENLPFKQGKTSGVIEKTGTQLTSAQIIKNAFKKGEGKAQARIKTQTKHGLLDVKGSFDKATISGAKDPALSGTIKATLMKSLTVGKGEWQTQVEQGAQVDVSLKNNTPQMLSAKPLKLTILKNKKKAAAVDISGKFNLRTLVLDGKGSGKLFKNLELGSKPRAVVTKDSAVKQLVISGNKLTRVDGKVGVKIFDPKKDTHLGDADITGIWLRGKGFTGKGQFDLKQEVPLGGKGAWTTALEPSKGTSVAASFRNSELWKMKGELSVRIDKSGKKLIRAKADGTYNGKTFTGKGSAKLINNLDWKKGKTKVSLEKAGTALDVVKINKSKFVEAKGKASARFKHTTSNGLLDFRGQIQKAHIDARKDTTVSGSVEAELLKEYTVGKGTWQTQIQKKAKATLTVRDSKPQTFEASALKLLVLKDKKKAAQVDVQAKFNLRTLVLDAKGAGKLFQDLQLTDSPKVVVEKESAVKQIVVSGNKLTKIDGTISVSAYEKTGEKIVENAHLGGVWTNKSGFTGEGGGKTARDLTAGKPDGAHAVIKKGAGVKKITVKKSRVTRAEGGALQMEVHDKEGRLMGGGGTLKTLVVNDKGYTFTGGGNLSFHRSLKIGNKTGKGVRIVNGTKVGAQVVDNVFTRVGGTLKLGVDGSDGKEVATGALENVDVDMRKKDPVVSGKGSFTTRREFKIGSLVTVKKDLKATAEIKKNELVEAGVKNARFTLHKLNDGKGAEGKVSEATLKFPKVGMPDFDFLGGAVDDFKMLSGKLIGKLSKLSFKKGKFGGLGTGNYRPNKLIDALMSLRFDPSDGLMIPWLKLKGDMKLPLLKKYKFVEKGMPGKKPWTLANFGVTVKGVRGAVQLKAGYELGTEPLVLESTLDTGEFNPEKLALPDFTAKAKVKGTAYAKGFAEVAGLIGVGKEDKAFAGLKASGKLDAKLAASLTPSGSIYARGGELGGKIGADFNVTGNAALEGAIALVAQLLGEEERTPDFWKGNLDFGELFNFGYSADLGFGPAEGKGKIEGDQALPKGDSLKKEATKAYETSAKVTDKPATSAATAPGGGSAMKEMETKIEAIKIFSSLVKAGISVADLLGSAIPPGIKTVTAIVVQGKFMKASNACLDLSIALDEAERKGVLDQLTRKEGALKDTIELLKDYNDIINSLSGPSVQEMFDNSMGAGNFTGNAMVVLTKANNVHAKIHGADHPWLKYRIRSWHNKPLCSWSDVSSRGAMSHAAGALEWVGAVDKGTDPLQEMSKKDWARKLRKHKKEWNDLDQVWVDKYLAGAAKFSLARL